MKAIWSESPGRLGERIWSYGAQRGLALGTAADHGVVSPLQAVPGKVDISCHDLPYKNATLRTVLVYAMAVAHAAMHRGNLFGTVVVDVV